MSVPSADRSGARTEDAPISNRRRSQPLGLFRGPEVWIFLAAWVAYAAFHQGGGWHQNARFAGVRAIVEEGRLSIDHHALYLRRPDADSAGALLQRVPVEGAAFEIRGRRFALAWTGSGAPLDPDSGDLPLARIDQSLATGDVAYAEGHLLPNKAPAATWIAAPAYAAALAGTRVLDQDPDHWWVLTRNAWITAIGSVGLLSALGVALFFREARRLTAGEASPALLATCVFAFGTPYFPYATMLFDANIAAVALLVAWAAGSRPSRLAWWVCGAATGAAVAATYSAALAVPLLALRTTRRGGLPSAVAFATGLALPLALSGWHHSASLGTPFATPYQYQDPLFLDAAAWLGVLDAPSLERLAGITISPFRGLFFCSPVLVLGMVGLGRMLRDPEARFDGWILSALIAVFVLFNVCFNGWHGGWSVGPRYLVPVLPLLALPIAIVARRMRRLVLALGLVSIASMTLFTAVDPQPPVGTSPIADRPDRSGLWRSPLTEYILPIFTSGQATPILDAQREGGSGEPTRDNPASALSYFEGPVSANPIGIYEAWIGRVLPATGDVPRWNAFNVGEFLWPQRRLSLVVPGLAVSALLGLALRSARRTSTPPSETA
jgi:hypothetical protein